MGRILMVVRPSKGGAFGHVARLSRALAEAGHDVAIAGPHGARAGELPGELIELEMGRSISPREDVAAIAKLAAAMRRWAPDLIHAHGSKGGVAARLARASTPRVPLVFTPHNYAFTNYFASEGQRRAYRVVETALSPLATRVLCVCEAEGRVAATVGPKRRVRVVHNGVGPFSGGPPPARLEAKPNGGPVVASVTELQEPKGVPTLVEAAPLVLERHPDATFLIAGDGPMRAEIEALIDQLGVASSVHLLGQIERVPGLLAMTDVFAASGWSESLPYAILEAMSAELPIAATDVGGVGEAIENGVTGCLVPPQDATALASAISGLLDDRERAGKLAVAARARMEARFTFAGMVEGTRGVYAELGVD